MHTSLQRDICQVGYGPIMNADILDLDSRLAEFVHEDLCYACCFWTEHLSRLSPEETELQGLVQQFVSQHFLDWLEVLSLMGLFDGCLSSLRIATDWVQVMPFYHISMICC
jgi:hypothetical protein